MSKLPQLNLRIPDPHHELVRQIAARLRESGADAFAAQLQDFLSDAPAPPAVDVGDLSDQAELGRLPARVAQAEGQLLILEARLAALEGVKAPEPQPEPLQIRKNIPDELLQRADDFHKRGHTWLATAHMVSKELGYEVAANSVRNAIRERLKKRQPSDQAPLGR